MAVERLAKYQIDDPFTRIPNTAISDPALDLKALGLLTLMLSKPDGWRFVERNLATDAGVGRAQIRTAIATLVEAGYVARETEIEDGRPITVTKVADVPRWREGLETEPSPGSDSPTVRDPDGPETEPPSNNSKSSNEGHPSNNGSSSDLRPAGDDEPQWPVEVMDLTREFAGMVKANGHALPARGSKAADSWLRDMDRLLRLGPPGDTGDDPPPDGDEIRAVMRWALTVDDFWPANIRAVPKFRQQFTVLRAQMRRQANGKRPPGVDLAAGYSAAAERLRSR